MFQGTSSISLDAKGRIAIPARHRDALLLQCEGRMTLTRHPDGCLLLFPRPVWETLLPEFLDLPGNWRRIYVGKAENVEMDASGRILISQELRNRAELKREVELLGVGSHFEIWDAERLAENEAATIAAGTPDVLQNFSF